MNAFSDPALTISPSAPRAAEDERSSISARRLRIAALATLSLAIGFNMVLALVNAHGPALSGAMVAGAQGLLTLAAFGCGLMLHGGGWRRWAAMAWGAGLLWLLLSIVRGSADVKLLGDAVTLPAFALLGACLTPRLLIRWLVGVQIVVSVLALWELAAPASFAATLDITAYYVNTRGISPDAFWSSDNEGVFLNVERATGRMFLPDSGLNRATSLFLEPVSLGNWVVIVGILLLALWARIGWRDRIVLASLDLFLLVACDGRFALAAGIAILLSWPVVRWGPRWLPLLYLPMLMLGLFALSFTEYLPRGGDTFVGRLRKGIDYLSQLQIVDVLGASGSGTHAVNADSGWAYLIQSQSLIGLIGFWLLIVLMMPPRTTEARRFVNATALYFALCMPISYSFLSIKTVAPIMAAYGCIAAAALGRRSGSPGDGSRPA